MNCSTDTTVAISVLMVADIVPKKMGSYEIFMIEFTRACQSMGIECHWLLPAIKQESVERSILDLGGKIHLSPSGDLSEERHFFAAFHGLIKSHYFHVVTFHFCNEIPVFTALLWQQFRFKRSLMRVWHQHSEIAQLNAGWKKYINRIRLICPLVDRFLHIYQGGVQHLLDRGVPPSRASFVHNGIRFQPPQRSRAQVRQDLAIGEDTFVLITVASLIKRKSVDTILRGLAGISQQQHHDVVLLVVGEGAERQRLEALAVSLGVNTRIYWLGLRDDVADLLAASDVFVLASLAEPFGFVNVEAMAQALPVVASRVGGLPEIVVDGETGLLFKAGDTDALQHALLRLLDDSFLRKSMGEAGRDRVRVCFEVDRTVQAYLRVYLGELSTSDFV